MVPALAAPAALGEVKEIYNYAQVKGSVFNMTFHDQSLLISFDEGGVVSDVEYVSHDEK